MRERIFPGTVGPGATLGIVSPSSPVTPKLGDGIAWLKEQGFDVVVAPHAWDRRGILAGLDHERLADLHAMFANPGIDAVLASGGGYGTHRLLLQGLDYELIASNPKPLVGFSDITGLHLALWKRLSMVTVHGPNVASLVGISDEARQAWLRVLTSPVPAKSVGVGAGGLSVLVPGSATGLLVGGNIALVCTLLGTQYEIDTRGAVLFLENIDDRAYRFDRYLAMLRLAGKFRDCAGVIVGTSVKLTSTGGDGFSTMESILKEHLAPEQKPAVYGFPAGHMAHNLAFPVGTLVTLAAERGGSAQVVFHESLAGASDLH